MTGHLERTSTFDVDQRPRQLLEKYTSIVGAIVRSSDGLVEFEVPAAEQAFWNGTQIVRAALFPETLDEYPDAEILAVGSPLFGRLLAVIRVRGFRESRGVVMPQVEPLSAPAALPVKTDGASSEQLATQITLLPVGRLLVRVSLKAGVMLEERLVESLPIDFVAGNTLPAALVQALDRPTPPETPSLASTAVSTVGRSFAELLPMMFSELERQLAPELRRMQEEATRGLAIEIHRLDTYYERMVTDVEDEEDSEGIRVARRAIRAEQQRRREEEEDRHRLKVTIHPLQATEWQVLAQRTEWKLTTPQGRVGRVFATRLLSGMTDWQLVCPTCGASPDVLRVCREGHVSCRSCSEICGVCGEAGCRTHRVTSCTIGSHPVCSEHALTCPSCGNSHCVQHQAHCDAHDHEVCPSCALNCGSCGKSLCRDHAIRTGKDAPRGERRLCTNCTVLCEGGTNEPVGVDEAVRCASCERHICESHRVACAVDGRPHCSRHLRRSDRSGRLVCEQHRAACAEEPHSILASDEVASCATCNQVTCQTHGAPCYADHAHFCLTHLADLADRRGEKACAHHRTTCHIDNVIFSLEGTRGCAVCARSVCDRHRNVCTYCARQACANDITEGRCATCARLAHTADPADDLVQAALAAAGGEPVKTKGWRTAQDASGFVVEMNLGWTRKLVFTVLHGDTKPQRIVRHSILGASRKR